MKDTPLSKNSIQGNKWLQIVVFFGSRLLFIGAFSIFLIQQNGIGSNAQDTVQIIRAWETRIFNCHGLFLWLRSTWDVLLSSGQLTSLFLVTNHVAQVRSGQTWKSSDELLWSKNGRAKTKWMLAKNSIHEWFSRIKYLLWLVQHGSFCSNENQPSTISNLKFTKKRHRFLVRISITYPDLRPWRTFFTLEICKNTISGWNVSMIEAFV